MPLERREGGDDGRGRPRTVDHARARGRGDEREPSALDPRLHGGTVDGGGDPGDGVADCRRIDVHPRADVGPEDPGLDALQSAHRREPVARVRGGAHGAGPVRSDAELRRRERERAPAGDELDRRMRERVRLRLERVPRRAEPHPAHVQPADRRPLG